MTNDDRIDTELGEALRNALQTGDDDAFAMRVVDAAEEAGLVNGEGSWDVLNMWARPGLVAAAIAAGVFLASSLGRSAGELIPGSIAEEVHAGATVAEMSEPAPPEPESIMAIAFTSD